MLDIEKLRKYEAKIVTIGSYPSIIQSILDFDFLAGKKEPSIVGIFASGRKYERYFFGKQEIMIPVFPEFEEIPENTNLFLNLSSGRRTLNYSNELLDFENILGGVVFAEEVPEKHSLYLYTKVVNNNKFLIGPASVGFIIPKILKLGAIGGVDPRQLIDSALFDSGNVAVMSSSGGMTNEIIRMVTNSGLRLSFALSFGGERFPILTPTEAFLSAQKDGNTKHIIYFGELGGVDEYEIAKLIYEKKITKNVIAYIAGSVAEVFPNPPQFGHAKAIAKDVDESARSKKKILSEAGVMVAENFSEFIELINNIEKEKVKTESDYSRIREMEDRRHALIATSISQDVDGNVKILGEDLVKFTGEHSFSYIVISLFLGRKSKSKELEDFTDLVLKLSVDHGPYVSGAVNTIITARAGKDLVSSLSSGLLTIGSRFGGAINQAAENWFKGVIDEKNPSDFVEEFASKREYISGIGHKKYRVDAPDPRVIEILKFKENLKENKFSDFALAVEKVTTEKKGNLILNVDGVIAAVLLDILSEKENLTIEELQKLIDAEFFNALFVLSRSVGFIAHYLDQKRLDEGIFRLDEDQVFDATIDK